MRRIYSPNKAGIRVESTPGLLLQALESGAGRSEGCFIGQVTYLPKKTLLSLLQGNPHCDWRVERARALLRKRREFAHERVVRLIYCRMPIGDVSDAGTTLPIPIDSSTVFKSLQFDPRMDAGLADALSAGIRSIGYAGRTSKSKLYQPPFD